MQNQWTQLEKCPYVLGVAIPGIEFFATQLLDVLVTDIPYLQTVTRKILNSRKYRVRLKPVITVDLAKNLPSFLVFDNYDILVEKLLLKAGLKVPVRVQRAAETSGIPIRERLNNLLV